MAKKLQILHPEVKEGFKTEAYLPSVVGENTHTR